MFNSCIEDLDSWMIQTIGHNVVETIAECVDVPFFQVKTDGVSKNRDLQYKKTEEDEVEDLFRLVSMIKVGRSLCRQTYFLGGASGCYCCCQWCNFVDIPAHTR